MSDAYAEGFRARWWHYTDDVSCPYPPDTMEEEEFYQGVAAAAKEIRRETEREEAKAMFRLFGC